MSTLDTLAIPTVESTFMDALTGSHGTRLNAVNLYDFAQFAEDFVLNDRVLVFPSLYTMLEPDFRPIYPEVGSVLLDAEKALLPNYYSVPRFSTVDLLELIIRAERLNRRAERKFNMIEQAHSSAPESLAVSSEARADYMNEVRLLLTCVEEYQLAKGRLDSIVNPMGKHLEIFIKRNDVRHVSLGHLLAGNLDLGPLAETAGRICSMCKRARINVSPGIGYATYFTNTDVTSDSAIKILHEVVSSSHEEYVKSIAKTGGLRIIYVPPILSILLERTRNRENLLEELVKLRSEFQGLREQGRYFKEGLTAAVTLKEKIDVLNDFERSRDALMRRVTRKPARSVVKEVWDIVKGKSLWGGLTKIADLALQFDQDRQLIRRVSHFQLMSDLALKVPYYESLLEKIYGTKSIDYGDLRISSNPWSTLVKAQAAFSQEK
jgi:hypothetical protein